MPDRSPRSVATCSRYLAYGFRVFLVDFPVLLVDFGGFLIAGWRVAGPVRLPSGRPEPGRLGFATVVIIGSWSRTRRNPRRIRLGGTVVCSSGLSPGRGWLGTTGR